MTGDRWELLRALAAIADSPAAAPPAAAALGLGTVSAAEHTTAFVLNCSPYASVYLGPDGALGGEGADRAAGFWRAIGLPPPAEPDHLSALLSLYASLGEAAAQARKPSTASALRRTQAALLYEHLASWLPGYLDAVASLPLPALSGWAQLTQRALTAECRAVEPPRRLPLALRAAPAPPGPGDRLSDLIGAFTTPVRSGLILTRHRLSAGAQETGVGYRIGERRFALRAMLEQDPAATLTWISREAARWEQLHAARVGAYPADRWWAKRAVATARLTRAAASAAATADGTLADASAPIIAPEDVTGPGAGDTVGAPERAG
jgi:TorA maturation chaperone TorD